MSIMRKLGLGRSFERALSKSIGYFSSLIIFLIAVWNSVHISSSFIFSVLVVTGIVNFFTLYAMYGIDLLHELNIVFTRFANIVNIQPEKEIY